MSERRACRLLSVDRSSYRYRQRTKNDEALCVRLRVLAARHPRYGYRRLGELLRREGQRVNHKKVERLYREQGLAVRRRNRKRLTARADAPGASQSQPAVVAGLRQRHNRTRTPPPPVNGDRRVHARMPSDRDRHFVDRPPRDGRSRTSSPRPSTASNDSGRQRTGIHLAVVPVLVRRQGHPARFHRTGQADAERFHRKLQRTLARRMPQCQLVSQPAPRATGRRRLAHSVQSSASA